MKRLVVAAAAMAFFVPQALAFDNTEPLASKQWYLTADRAWNYWKTRPKLATIKVAVIDSGIDYGHPEFAGRIAGGVSFVTGSWKDDNDGHGTFVAGEIAANPLNGRGIAGLAFNAKLLIAKVVRPDGSVSLEAEIKAIRWAANNGARVINLSIGGQRDPVDPELDTYSAGEQAAVDYAYSKGAVVVAADGNGTESPAEPWNYADYPAALPHVIGVGAIRRNGSVPEYSNRDKLYVDLVAPGDGIVSTIPRNLVDNAIRGCKGQPYSNCGTFDYRDAIGTSFAAPQVTAAAALLLGVDPHLRPDQVAWLLERSAQDETPATGCSQCTPKHDRFTGFGRLDVLAALRLLAHRGALPPPDRDETNDNTGAAAHPFGHPHTIAATLDYWDDPVDVYSIKLAAGRRLYARLSANAPRIVELRLWMPGTPSVTGPKLPLASVAAYSTAAANGQRRLVFDVTRTGVYYLEAKVFHPTRRRIVYRLGIATTAG